MYMDATPQTLMPLRLLPWPEKKFDSEEEEEEESDDEKIDSVRRRVAQTGQLDF